MPELLPVNAILFQNLLRDLQVIAPPRVPVWELSNVIQPVSIVNSQVTLTATVDERTMLFATNGATGVPAAGFILAGTGQLPAGTYLFRIFVTTLESVVINRILVQHRDAADAANIWEFQMYTDNSIPSNFFTMEWTEDLVEDESMRLVVFAGGGAGSLYDGIIWRSLIS